MSAAGVDRVRDVTRYVRSKNAGPFWVTIDLFCDDDASFERIAAASALQCDAIAKLYGVAAADVRRFPDAALRVLKISFPRATAQGATADRDCHAGQMFVPLLELVVEPCVRSH